MPFFNKSVLSEGHVNLVNLKFCAKVIEKQESTFFSFYLLRYKPRTPRSHFAKPKANYE